jgi:F0F1-type ATP synthase membrane subunit c/vacuolar-type H+-ATPase subunit K
MARSLKTLRMMQWAMLLSVLLYVGVGEILGPRIQRIDPALSYLFSTLAVGIVGTIFVIRRTLVLRAASTLASQPEDSLSLSQWKTGYITTYALCEALALFGLVLRFRGSELQQSLLFYVGGFVLLFFFRPRQPETQSAT